MNLQLDFQLIGYVLYALTAIVWLVSMLRTLSYRHLGQQVERARTVTPPDESDLPALSVIITTHDQEDELRHHLPLILSQIYPNFEVIVVDMNSTDNTKKLLERMEEDNLQLHHTFTPATSRDISQQRLAITLGVKASLHPWFVVTQADCCPVSHLWLRHIGEAIANHRSAEIVMGYTRFNHARRYSGRRLGFFRLWQEQLTLDYIAKGGAYRCDGTNMAYKRGLFLSHQGFASHSSLLVGATDIMVNQHSTKNNTAICLHPESIISQDYPESQNFWKQERLFFQETRCHFTHKWGYRMRYFGSVLLHALLNLFMIISVGFSIWRGEYIVTGAIYVLWLIHLIMQSAMFNTTARACNGRAFSPILVAWFIHLIPFWDTRAWLRHAFTNKQQFRKKYI